MTLAVIEHTEYPFARGELTPNGNNCTAEPHTPTPDTNV